MKRDPFEPSNAIADDRMEVDSGDGEFSSGDPVGICVLLLLHVLCADL